MRWSVFLTAIVAVVAAGCAGGEGDERNAVAGTPVPAGKITVFAAASLTDSFNEIKREFVGAYPRTQVEFQFAGSPTLRTQLEQGARADVFASADMATMAQALSSGVVQDSGRVFARNTLVIVTPKSNPGRISSPADLRRSGLKLVLAAPEVPVGSYSRQSLAKMDKDASFGGGFADAVLKNVVSNESNVKQVVAKVQLGEADAGIVYATDVSPDAARDLAQIAIPPALNVVAEYPIALTSGAANPITAEAFVAFVLGPQGQAILRKHGFQGVGG